MLSKLFTTILLSLSLTTPITLGAPTTSQALSKRSPSVTYQLGQLEVAASNTFFLTLDNNVGFGLQSSNSKFVVYQNGFNEWNDNINHDAGCSVDICKLIFQGDGNLVSYINGKAKWSSGTANRGNTLYFNNKMPFIDIHDAAGRSIWHTPLPQPDPDPGCGTRPCP